MTNKIIFLTGATGFLGAQIARQILQTCEAQLVVLLRGGDVESSRQRLLREWWDWPDAQEAMDGRVEVLAGDITLPRLGLSEAAYRALAQKVTHMIHAAADIRLFAPLDELQLANLTGTRRVLELAQAVQAEHGLSCFAHVSSAYVAGRRSGPVAEEELSDRCGFSSPYEQSKYEAELLVREAMAHLPGMIFRPGLIVGDSRDGTIKTFNTLYFPLRLYLTGRLRVAPASPALRVNLVPVDYVASSIARLVFDPSAIGLTFHLTPPLEDMPTLAGLTTLAREWAEKEMGIRLPRPWFLPLPGLEAAARRFGWWLPRDLAELARLLPYFRNQPVFLRINTDRLLGPYPHRWQDLLPRLLEYAVQHSFWGRAGRTVHEQVLLRLKSVSKPVRYHDLSAGQEIIRPGAEVRAEILAAAAALRGAGIRPGERVVIVGPNSTRYFASLVAIGLAGAVSAPVYATSPSREIERLLKDCQTRLLLVGSREVLERLDEIDFDGKVVSFMQGDLPPRVRRQVIEWTDFLAMGAGQQPAETAPVGLDAPAAQFFTSGTTGQPRSVVYRHDQLRWLARSLASAYPWRERNRWGAYLSYLPMNHVVEGILGTFSPYYVPAALDIYFLEEFKQMPWALKAARPTIFFSVPRFFEKVRAAASQHPLARVTQRLPEGLLRRLINNLLRRGLLRKTGLDRCRQAIVGSALTHLDVLVFFQDLGIPVHNAYGLTEAALVSLNRLGRNRVGTLGQPLPETELRFGPDGEILVRGPQVTAGYWENGQLQSFPGGWLETGDLGALTPDGYLTLNGRKKELLITAYARKIFPAPVEAGLRAIPGVAEALLVGEGRPFCAALLWMEEDSWSSTSAQVIDEGMSVVNGQLSPAEQIKRWAVLPGQLTVADGALSSSLKVKRAVVAERLRPIIDALYGQGSPPGVLHAGGVEAG